MTPLALLLLLAPAADPAAKAPAADNEFFEARVRPLLVEHCQACHSTKAKKDRGGLLLDSRATLLKGGDTGPAVVPGDPDKSLLIQAVRYQDKTLHMPPKGKLGQRDIATLEEWVRRGAPFPGPADGATVRPTVNIAEGRKFWSFQPLRAVPPPIALYALRGAG